MNIVFLKTLPGEYNGFVVWYKEFLKACLEGGHKCVTMETSWLCTGKDFSWGLGNEYVHSDVFNDQIASLEPDVIFMAEELKKLHPSFFERFSGKIYLYAHDIANICPYYGCNPFNEQVCSCNKMCKGCYACNKLESYSGLPYEENDWWELQRKRLTKVHAIAPSEFVLDFLDCKKLCLSTRVVPNGIDLPPSTKSLRDKGSKKVLLVSGWGMKSDTINSITRLLKLSITNGFTFHAVGYSDEYVTGIEPVMDRSKIADLYNGYDIYLSLYQMKESYSLALAEANNFGLATVVCSGTGATAERLPTAIVNASIREPDVFEMELWQALEKASKIDTVPRYEGNMRSNIKEFLADLENSIGGKNV